MIASAVGGVAAFNAHGTQDLIHLIGLSLPSGTYFVVLVHLDAHQRSLFANHLRNATRLHQVSQLLALSVVDYSSR